MNNLKHKLNNEILTINLSGRITSDNAKEAEKKILTIINDNPHSELEMDIEGLEAISSAGLRTMLMLQKSEPSFRIINACSSVYEVFEITGFATIIDIQKAYRCLSVDNCEIIGEGAKGIVYRYDDDTIVKVYKSDNCLDEIKENTALAHKAFLMGIPTAISYDIVKVGNRFGSVYELVNPHSLSELIESDPKNLSDYAKQFSSLLLEVEKVTVDDGELPNIKDRVLDWAKRAESILTAEESKKIQHLIKEVPDDSRVIHGDFHSNNIVIQNGEPLLLDLDTLACGNPIFEFANIHFSYVALDSIYPSDFNTFLGISSDKCREFYKCFIEEYFKSVKNIDDISNKIAFMGYLRAANHVLKREKNEEIICRCAEFLKKSLEKVDSLAIS